MTSKLLCITSLFALSTTLFCHRCDESHSPRDVDKFAFDCSSRNITRLPVNVSSRATELNLAYNNIAIVPQNAFRHLPNLTKLDLSDNRISILQKNCFAGLVHLRQLILPNNKLDPSRLPSETFACLPALQLLAISRQGRAGEYPEALLETLNELTTLSVTVQHVDLPEIYGRLPKITNLVLEGIDDDDVSSHLRIIKMNTFAALRNSNVSSLKIRHAKIDTIEHGAFSNFKNLRVLNLCCNYYLNVRQVVHSLGQSQNTSIDTVILDGTSRIQTDWESKRYDINYFCDGGKFWNSVKRLSLRNVRLKTFIPQDVYCLSGLQEIYIDYNPLTFTTTMQPKLAHYFVNLQKIFITYSNVMGADFIYKYCRAYGRKLFFTEDYIPRYPQLFPVVNSSDLQSTSKIQKRPVDFYIPPSINFIDAGDSNVKFTPHNSGVLSFNRDNNVLFLNVSNAYSFERVDSLLVGLTQLQILDASYGIVETIHPEFHKHLPFLRVLNQSHNNLGRADNDFKAIFSFAKRIENIDLSGNDLKYMNRDAFSKLIKLKQIKLESNAFRHFDVQLVNLVSLELLNISENRLPFLAASFMTELDKLNGIATFAFDMRRNPLTCYCDSIPFIRWLHTTGVNVVDRTEMTCLFRNTSKRIVDIPLSNLENECYGTFLSRAWTRGLIGAGTVTVFICLLLALFFISYRFSCCKLRRSQMLYDAAVLYDEYNDYVREWIETDLIVRAETQWKLKLLVLGRQCDDNDRETLAAQIAKSDKLIICLTQTVLEIPEILEQFRIDFTGSRPHHKYIFLRFESFRIPEEWKIVLKKLILQSSALRLNWDRTRENVFWPILHRYLQKDTNFYRCRPVNNRRIMPWPEYSYLELEQQDNHIELDEFS